MVHKFLCPACGQRISATPEQIGTTGICPGCNAGFIVPTPEGEAQPAAPRVALVACPDCAREVSPRAVTCPHCGAPLKKSRPTLIILGLLLLAGGGFIAITAKSPEAFMTGALVILFVFLVTFLRLK